MNFGFFGEPVNGLRCVTGEGIKREEKTRAYGNVGQHALKPEETQSWGRITRREPNRKEGENTDKEKEAHALVRLLSIVRNIADG